ncbi:hypothetical protein [Burkholderia alba]|nr:hypothetical protein [Burkholderia alba]
MPPPGAAVVSKRASGAPIEPIEPDAAFEFGLGLMVDGLGGGRGKRR